jgi:hypothetical protein
VLRNAIVTVQALTFVALAAVLYKQGDWKLATAQLMLAIITFLVYG